MTLNSLTTFKLYLVLGKNQCQAYWALVDNLYLEADNLILLLHCTEMLYNRVESHNHFYILLKSWFLILSLLLDHSPT